MSIGMNTDATRGLFQTSIRYSLELADITFSRSAL